MEKRKIKQLLVRKGENKDQHKKCTFKQQRSLGWAVQVECFFSEMVVFLCGWSFLKRCYTTSNFRVLFYINFLVTSLSDNNTHQLRSITNDNCCHLKFLRLIIIKFARVVYDKSCHIRELDLRAFHCGLSYQAGFSSFRDVMTGNFDF